MKKLILLSGFLLSTVLAFSQIKVQSMEKTTLIGKCDRADLSYIAHGKDTTYFITFRNAEYTTLSDYKTVEFSGEGNTLSSLYDILMSFFSDQNRKNKEYEVPFMLGDNQMLCKNFRMLGCTSVTFCKVTKPSGFCYLTEGQVKKLFNRQDPE